MICLDDSLSAHLGRYLVVRSLSAAYAAQLVHRIAEFDRWRGRPVRLREIDDELVSEWIASLQAQGRLAPKTIHEYRAAILAIWRDAYEQRLCDCPPGRVRGVLVQRRPPEAWTIDEVRALLAAAERLPGVVRGTEITRAAWFGRWVRLAWDTALRLSDLLAIRREQIDGDGILRLAMSKTARPLCVRLSPATVAMLPDSELLLPWPGCRRQVYYWLRRLIAEAGIRPGSSRWLRRSAASYLERDHPGAGRLLLGHRSAGLAERHYFDPAIVGSVPPSPPEL